MSLQSLVNITQKSIRAARAGMDTVGQNIANKETEGFKRRRITLQSESSQNPALHTASMDPGPSGMGVSVASYERLRDHVVERSMWKAHSNLGSSNERARMLSSVEGIVGEGQAEGLRTSLDAFWSSWKDVADHPTDKGARQALLSRSQTLTDKLHNVRSGLTDVRNQAYKTLEQGVSDANATLDQIAGLNSRIFKSRSQGTPDLAAEDERDRLVNKLSSFAPVEVQEEDNMYQITIEGMAAVRGKTASHLDVQRTSSGTAEVTFQESGVAFTPETQRGGQIGGWLNVHNDVISQSLGQLDQVASDLVSKVNEEHREAFDLEGGTGKNFFDPNYTNARTISLGISDPEAIQASAGADQPGDTQPAQNIAQMRDAFSEQVINIATQVGAKVERANSQADAHSAKLEHLQGLAAGTSGVSVDEELTNLLKHQQQFQASARVLSTARDMMNTLFQI